MKLKARVPCRQLFYEAYDGHVFGEESTAVHDDTPDSAVHAAAVGSVL